MKSILSCSALALVLICAGPGRAVEPVNFSRDIRPILSDKCYKCHGPDSEERQAEFRLDLKQGALEHSVAGGGLAIKPGDSGKSEVYRRISSNDEDLKMPPVDSGKQLAPREVELIKRWIDEGAGWQRHWSFIPPRKAVPPRVALENRVANSIDRFAFRKLEREGLKPSPSAGRVGLIRRVTLDLTGMPPTPIEVARYLADKSPQAYERVVDRLLASRRFGEHQARYWLDAARYGDTHGLHLDNERSIWPYRDWVIRAFNRNLPFDQFTIEQLAGDLLPEATIEQKVATGFNRCNVTTSEGGAIRKEFRVRYAIDRVETTSTVWMGLTTGCAVCHEHKFDPISQEEFYQLYAYFYSFQEDAMDGNKLLPSPVISVLSPESNEKRQAIETRIAAIKNEIRQVVEGFKYEEPKEVAVEASDEPREFVWVEDDAPAGAKLLGNTPWQWVAKDKHPVFSGNRATQRTASGLSQHFFENAKQTLRIGEGDILFTYVYLDPKNPPKEIMLQFNSDGWEHRAIWGEDAIAWGKKDSPSRLRKGDLPEAGKWVRLEVEAAKVNLPPGTRVHGWAFTQFGGNVYWDKAGIVTKTPQSGRELVSLLAWEKLERGVKKSKLPTNVQAALKIESEKRSETQQKSVRDYFIEHVHTASRATIKPLREKLEKANAESAAMLKSLPQTLVMGDRPKPLDTYVLIRGQYDREDKTRKVQPGVPSILPALPKDAPPNRLGLARWLVSGQHPLTGRVTVNRIWQQYFGEGIVKTAEDFGAQGEWPSHPELLDWLAVEFVESGWNLKHLHKLIVMSSTYRQSSRMRAELLERDPSNRLLARGPRFRLDAEVIRDSALSISGLLIDRIGGRGVRPYQPIGLWNAVGYSSSNTANFKRDSGENLYRRSLYTFWKRTSPPPVMSIFDAPSREACAVRRSRTNTPQQALLLMNDEQFVEAARRFARRMLTEGGKTTAERIEYAFRLAVARRPDAEEHAIFAAVLKAHLAEFKQDQPSALKLLSVGESKRDESLDPVEHAAWTMVANLMLNLDETVSKE